LKGRIIFAVASSATTCSSTTVNAHVVGDVGKVFG